MKNKDKDLLTKLKAENPTLTNEQIEELVAEYEASSSDESEGDLLKQIAEERAALAEEREAIEEEKALFETEKAELEAKKAALKAAESGAQGGEHKKYICTIPCTFDGIYFREGDVLTTAKSVPEFFTELS